AASKVARAALTDAAHRPAWGSDRRVRTRANRIAPRTVACSVTGVETRNLSPRPPVRRSLTLRKRVLCREAYDRRRITARSVAERAAPCAGFLWLDGGLAQLCLAAHGHRYSPSAAVV